MARVEGIDQQTPEWIVARVGCATSSRTADVMATLKRGGESAARRNYKYELVIENLTGRAADHYVSPAMEWGIENQVLAQAAYEMHQGTEVEPGGFWLHDEIPRFAASPDSLVGEDGLVEYKCPLTSTHLDTLIAGTIPEEYQYQLLAQMSCTGRQWVDFVSFDPRLPKHLQLFIKRFWRDEKRIKEVEDGVCQFLIEVVAMIKQLEGATHVEAAADQEAHARAV